MLSTGWEMEENSFRFSARLPTRLRGLLASEQHQTTRNNIINANLKLNHEWGQRDGENIVKMQLILNRNCLSRNEKSHLRGHRALCKRRERRIIKIRWKRELSNSCWRYVCAVPRTPPPGSQIITCFSNCIGVKKRQMRQTTPVLSLGWAFVNEMFYFWCDESSLIHRWYKLGSRDISPWHHAMLTC